MENYHHFIRIYVLWLCYSIYCVGGPPLPPLLYIMYWPCVVSSGQWCYRGGREATGAMAWPQLEEDGGKVHTDNMFSHTCSS